MDYIINYSFLLTCMDDLYNLEVLSLVAKITQEVENYTGLNDKTIAEFIIDLHDQSNAKLVTFKQKLKENGADFPESFVDTVDRLILSMHPKHKKKHVKANGASANPDTELAEQDKQKRLFPGLALKDQEPKPAVADDVFLKEIGDLVSGKKTRERPWEDDRETKRQRRSRSPPQRRSPSPPRGRDRYSRGARALDEKPILFKIYEGRVSGVKEFGAFVGLEGIAGRAEGAHLYDC